MRSYEIHMIYLSLIINAAIRWSAQFQDRESKFFGMQRNGRIYPQRFMHSPERSPESRR